MFLDMTHLCLISVILRGNLMEGHVHIFLRVLQYYFCIFLFISPEFFIVKTKMIQLTVALYAVVIFEL